MALPPRGSIQDQILRELVRRERNEKAALVEMGLFFLSTLTGADETLSKKWMEYYLEELHQTRYDPAIIRKKKAQRKVDQDLLKKVEKLTVPDDQLPPLPKPKRRPK